MSELAQPQFWVAAVEIVAVNILLSGDNAVVIALACRNLPPAQRRWGVFWGAFGAIALRVVLTVFALSLLALPWLKLVGGLLLLWIGVKLIAEEEVAGEAVAGSDRLVSVVRTVVVADLVMSLDNVLGVAAAANGSVVLLTFGLLVSIPLVIAGSQLILKVIERYPVLVVAGGALLGYIAGEMFVREAVLAPWIDARGHWIHWGLPIACALLVVVVAKVMERRQHR
ncbi:MAG TPA: TerC family protein [Casimicrobiaceae bacterium]|jgi:YjbE family integral membrane protein